MTERTHYVIQMSGSKKSFEDRLVDSKIALGKIRKSPVDVQDVIDDLKGLKPDPGVQARKANFEAETSTSTPADVQDRADAVKKEIGDDHRLG